MDNFNLKLKFLFIFVLFLILPNFAKAAIPNINSISNDSSAVGATYSITPTLSAGANVRWTKEYGPDDMTVDPLTGLVSWSIPANLPREAFHLGVKATNSEGSTMTAWILKVGGGNYLYVGAGETYTTISAATAAAVSGDTIVVRDGTYVGSQNAISNLSATQTRGNLPPSGNSLAYSTIMAEHPGQVVLDGQSARTMIGVAGNYSARQVGTQGYSYDARYIAVKGFIAMGSPASDPSNIAEIHLMHAQYIKLIDCGGLGSLAESSPFALFYSNHITVEGAYSWGLGRYGIVFYKSDYVIVRRSVVRIDRSTMVNPIGGIDFYAGQHSRGQNNIVIDQDQYLHYKNYTYIEGAFTDESGSSPLQPHLDNSYSKCLALNVANNFTTTGNDAGSDSVNFNDCVGWDLKAIPGSYGGVNANPWIDGGGGGNYNKLTLGALSSPYKPLILKDSLFPISFNGWNQTQNFTNSIIYNAKNYDGTSPTLFYGFENVDHNNIFDTGAFIIESTSTITNTILSDPTLNGLKYLPRVEDNSNLKNAGIGADLSLMVGKSGTLFDEAGFDADTSIPMWPFPHEDLIKQKMAAYSFTDADGMIDGARGFAAGNSMDGSAQTLTKYVWEYLGNQIPCEIYGTCGVDAVAPSAPSGLFVL